MLKYCCLFLHKLLVLLLLILLLLCLCIGIPLLFLKDLWKIGLLHVELVCLAGSANGGTFYTSKCLLNSWYDACCCLLTILSHHCFGTRLLNGSTIVCPTLLHGVLSLTLQFWSWLASTGVVDRWGILVRNMLGWLLGSIKTFPYR